MRTNLAERIENESVPEREERLEVARDSVREREGLITCLFRNSMLTVVNSICTKGDGKIQRILYTSKNG